MSVRSSALRRQSFVKSLPVFSLSMCTVLPAIAAAPAWAQTLPQGGTVVAGNAQIGGTDGAMKITQSSDKAIINWDNFSIGDKASVRIDNGSGATLNRVTGAAASSIDGLLSASGSVYLINKNGIVVGKTGQIDVGGRFVGSTQDISNQSFMAGGAQTLQGASEAPIVNYGKIGSLGGDVALIAAKVDNQGEITAANGSVGLLAGYQVILRDQSLNDGKFSVVVGGKDTSATNVGAIRAAEAELRAQGGNVYALAGNTTGIVNAQGVNAEGGRVFLTAGEAGLVTVSGSVSARKADGRGGTIEVTGTHILLDKGANLDASGTTGGTVLVGGDWQGGADASKTLAGHALAHSEAVLVDKDAHIDVTGTTGAGGKAVLWSDNYTNFQGSITADGATDGGMVETSSKNNLQAFGSVSARGLSGVSGQWLLDPSNVTISSSANAGGGSTGFGTSVFVPTANSANVNATTIMNSLNAGTNVTITTASNPAGATTQDGDITLASGTTITKSAGVDTTLTLQADRNIILNGTINSTSGKLNVNLNSRANSAANSTSSMGTIAFNGAITTNGGDINAWGGNGGVNTGAALNTTGAAAITVGAFTLNAGGGDITLTGRSTYSTATTNTGAINLVDGSLLRTSGSGSISLTGTSTAGWGVLGFGGITTTSGAMNVTGSGAIGVALRSTAVLTGGSGGITLTGTGGSTAGVSLDASGSTISAGTGGVTITGTSSSGVGVSFGAGTYASSGDFTINGTSSTNNGIYRSSSSTTAISAIGSLTLYGRSTGASSVQGILGLGTGSFNLTTTNGQLWLRGDGGATSASAAAIQFGNASTDANFKISGGTGGVLISGNSAAGAFLLETTGTGNTGSTINSAGAINATGAGSIYFRGSSEQTGAGASTINSTGGDVRWGSFAQTGGSGSLTVSGRSITLLDGEVGAKDALTISATNGAIDAGNLSSGGAMTVSATGEITAGAIAQSGASGAVGISAGTAITTGAISLATGDNSSIAATTSLSTGAITTAGNGDIALSAGLALTTAAMTKTTAAKNASTLTIKSLSNIIVANAITAASGAGALNVNLNSRAEGATTGFVNVNAAITTRGGNIVIGGNTSGTGYAVGASTGVSLAAAISTGGGNLTVYGRGTNTTGVLASSTINAGGGDISITGLSAGGQGIGVTGTQIITSGSGAINLDGTSQSTDGGVETRAVYFSDVHTLTGGTGGVKITGTSTGGVSVFFGSGNFTSAGDFTINGTSSTNNGIYRNSSSTTSISAAGALTLYGRSTASNSIQGVLSLGTGAFNLSTTTGLLTLKGDGGAVTSPGSDGERAAIQFGNSDYDAKININAGTGGLLIGGTSAPGAYTLRTTGTGNTGSTINSAGAMNVTGTGAIYFRGSSVQSGAGVSTISSTGDDVRWGSFAQTGSSGSLTISGRFITLLDGDVGAKNALTVRGASGKIEAGNLSSGGAMTVSATGLVTAGAITQSGASGAVGISAGAAISTGAISLATGDNSSIAATTSLNTGAITTSGNGDIALSAGLALTTAAITKTTAAKNASTLTIKSLSNIIVANAITAASGAGALNVNLNSRAEGATTGFVNVNAAMTTRGGNIVIGGNTSGTGYAVGTSTGVSLAAAILTDGGNLTVYGRGTDTAGVLASSTINANGGNISITGLSTNGQGIGVTGTQIITAGSGAINLDGTSQSTDTGVGTRGVYFSDVQTLTGGTGGATITGTSVGGVGVSFGSGLYTSAGDFTVNGTSSTNNGIYRTSTSTTKISATGALTLYGRSTGSNSIQGVLSLGTGLVDLSTTTGLLTIKGDGGAVTTSGSDGETAAIQFGNSDADAKININAGTGGLLIGGTSVSGAYLLRTTGTGNTGSVINSAGAMNVTGTGAIYFRGSSVQSGAGVSTISSTGGDVRWGSFAQTGSSGSLTVSGRTITLLDGDVGAKNALTVRATSGKIEAGNLSSGGAMTVSATGLVTAGAITQSGASGAVGISSGAAITAGVISLATDDNTSIAAATDLNTGAITTSGSGDITLSAGSALTAAAITKTAAASGASTLTIKSASDIIISNAINAVSGAGAFNVNLNSRSGGASMGAITTTAAITTRGGNIYAWGGSGAANSAAATSSTASEGVSIQSTLNAGGGNIWLTGTNSGSTNNTAGIGIRSTGTVRTSGSGTITLTGRTTNSTTGDGVSVIGTVLATGGGVSITGTGTGSASQGVNVLGSISSTSGGLSITGTGPLGVAVGAGATVSTTSGNLSVTGTGGTKSGISFDAASGTGISVNSTSGDISLSGSSTNVTGIYANAANGLTVSTGGSGAVSILGTGGANAATGIEAAAIKFGYTGAAATKVTIGAGTGGLTMKGTGSTGAAYSIYSSPLSADSSITSAGAIDMSGNNLGVVLGGMITQTGTQASTIASTAGDVTIGSGGGATSFTGALTITGRNLTVGGTLTDGSALTMTSTGSITTAGISQAAATNTGDLKLTAGTTLNVATIGWGTGDMALTSVRDLTLPTILKMSGATGTSTLTVKSDADLTVATSIQAASGAGPLNVLLNSRAGGASTGAINLNSTILTRGGDVTLRGGSATASTPADPTSNMASFVSALNATGAQISFGSSSSINAGGGDIELRGVSGTGTGLAVSRTVSTSGSGSVKLYGLGGTGSAASGVDVTGNVTTTSGTLTIVGATRTTGSGTGVIVEEGAAVTSSNGSIAVTGAGSATTGAGVTSVGVAVAGSPSGGRIAITGGSGTLTVIGKGGGGTNSNFGVAISGGSTNVGTIASASSGATTITGIGGSGTGSTNYGLYLDQGTSTTPVLNTTGAGALQVTGRVSGGTGYGIYQTNAARIGGGGSGAITLIANKMMLATGGSGTGPAIFNTTGALTLRPEAGGNFTVDGDILPSLMTSNAQRGSYGNLIFGSTDAASLIFKTTSAANSFAKALTFASGGALTISADASGNALTANAGLTLVGTGAVSQTVDLTASQISGTASALYLMNSGNKISAVSGLAVSGDLSLYSGSALTVKGVNTATSALLRSAGALTLDTGAKITATGFGTAINLVTAGTFVNNGGASALTTPAGRWLIWSPNTANDTLGGLSYAFIQHGGAYGSTLPAQSTGNGLVDATTPTLSISLVGNYGRDYDGTTGATLGQGNFAVTGLLTGETATVYSTATFDTKNVGSGKTIAADDLAVIVRNGAVKVYGYTLTDNRITGAIGTINQKLLTASLTGGAAKVYDGTTAGTLTQSNYLLSGVIGSDTVTINGPTSGTYADKNAGTNKLVTATGLTLSGADAGNYKVDASVSGNIGIITAKALTAALSGTISKIYDGNTQTTVGTGNIALSGVIGTDVVTAASGLGATFADKNAGTGKLVTANGVSLAGADAGNYTVLTAVSGNVGTITAKSIVLGAVTDSKTYDGTTVSTGIVRATGLVGGDTFTATQVFGDKNAGSRTLQVADGYVITDGNGGANYIVSKDAAVAGTITQRLVTTTLAADGKIYDAGTGATGSFSSLNNMINGDDVSLDSSNGTLSFLDRNAGAGKAVVATGYALKGTAAANYTLGAIGNGVATISKATLTLTAATDSKTYDGTLSSNKGANVTVSGLKGSDTLTAATQKFADKNAGTGKELVVDSWTIADGNGGNNYAVTTVNNATGTIARKSIAGTLTNPIAKTYDGTTDVILTGTSLEGIILGDAVTVASTSAAYADKNVGAGKLVTVSGMSLGGADAGNYQLQSTSTSANVGTITARQVVVSTTGIGAKTYDGTTTLSHTQLGTLGFTADATTQAMMTADGVTFATGGVAGTLADRNAGTGKVVTLTGYALDGNGLGNYVLVGSDAQGVVDVARKTLTLTAASDGKVYDGNTLSGALVQHSELVAGDSVTATQKFDSKDAGIRSLVVDNWSVSDGNGGANYAVVTAAATGAIDKRVVTTSLTANNKTYDGTTVATGTFAPLANLVAGETVGVSGMLNFADRNAGDNKAVVVTDAGLTGTDGRNYQLATIADGTASIAKALLTLTAGADSRQYNGTTTSSGTVTALGLGVGDSFTATQHYDNKNAGSRTLIVDAGYTVSDGNGGNNYIVTTANTLGEITKRVLTASVVVDSKTYDGTTTATGSFGSLDNLVSGETVSITGGTIAFADRNAGTGKAVNVSGATLSGVDADNYTLASLAAGTGTITPKALTLNAVTDTKTYDGTTASTGLVAATGLVDGDGIIATQAFDGKNAGSQLLQVASYTVLDGNGGGNYTVSIGDKVSGAILQKVLNATVKVDNKIYDGTTRATGSFDDADLTGVIVGDTVLVDSTTGQFAFVDRNAGNGKAVTVTGVTLTGADAGNYKLSNIANGSADIAKAMLTLTASNDGKTYDSTTASNGVVAISGLVGGDMAIATQAFDSKNAGTRSLVVNGWTITDSVTSDTSGGNYTIVKVDGTGSIARKEISGALTGVVSKVYDGTNTATILPTNLTGVYAGDAVNVSAASATYADQNAGTGKLVTVTGMTLGGLDAANYVLDQDHASANVGAITARAISINVTGAGSKTYDGTTGLSAAQLGTLTFTMADGDSFTQNLLAQDLVSLDGSAISGLFADRNAGTNKGVTLTGYALGNNSLGNYVLSNASVQGLATIAKAVLTLTAAGDTKIYNGTTASTGMVDISGLVGGDMAVATQAFDSKNSGTRSLVVNGWTITDGLSGDTDGGNYTVVKVDGAGSIAQKHLSGSLTGTITKMYDGTNVADILGSNLDGVIAGDVVTVSATSANYADKNAGTGKLVTVNGMSLTGVDAANYLLDNNSASANVGEITARTVTVSTTGIGSKTYDGTTGLVSGNLGGLVFTVDAGSAALMSADNMTLDASGMTGTLIDRNAGSGKSATLTGYLLTNNDLGNYVLVNGSALGVVDVARATLTLTAAGDSKTYDGNTSSTQSFTWAGLVGTDTVHGVQTFDGASAGNHKLIVSNYTLIDGNDGGNYTVVKVDADGVIGKRTVSTSLTANDKTYDGTTIATGTFDAFQNLISGDDLRVSADLSFADKNAGVNKAVSLANVVLLGAAAANYELEPITVAANTATIRQAALTLTAGGDTKTYDGNTVSNGTVTATGLAVGDSFTATQHFDNQNAGTRGLVVDGYAIADGNAGANYIVSLAGNVGTITKRVVTASVDVDTKTYDGNTSATGSIGNLGNVVSGETLSIIGGTLAFADRNAGTGKAVNVSGATLNGATADNYTLADLASGTGIITPKALVLTAGTDSKAYDATVASTGQASAFGLVDGDGFTAVQTFDGKDAGSHLLQITGYTVFDGNGGGNYTVTLGDAVAGTITKKVINASVAANDKTYDRTTAATGNVTGLYGVLNNEDVSWSGTGEFAFVDANAGNGKAVTVTGLTLSGAGAGNYQLSDVANGTANINKAILTLTAVTDSREYDGTTGSNGAVLNSGLIAGDTIVKATQAFDSKNAGDRILLVNGWTIDDGNGGGNYTVQTVDAAGHIDRKLLSGSLTGAVTKVYDGTVDAILAGANLDGVVRGDDVAVLAGSATYADKNAGTGKLVTVSGMSLSGADAANYVLGANQASASIGTITARQVGVATSGSGAKTYDGGTTLSNGQIGTIALTASDELTRALMAADGVSFGTTGMTGTLNDRNAGTGKIVTLTGYTLADNDLGNYVLAGTAQGVADVARATLTLTAVDDTKTYDGTTLSTQGVLWTGLIGNDTVSATQKFDGKDAGSRTLVVGGYEVSDGNNGGNYAVVTVSANGTINKRLLTATATANDKIYDGTTTATGSFGALDNLVGGETVGVTGTLNFVDRNAGDYKAVNVTNAVLTGNDARNYELAPITAAFATIAKANLILTAGTDSRQYDGTTVSSGTVTAIGLGAGDSFTATQHYDGKNAGNRTLIVDGYSVNDGLGGANYIITTATNTGTIAKRVLTTSVSVNTKEYDGFTSATGSFGDLVNVLNGENVFVTGGTIAFADRNAGTGKAVNVTGATLDGTDAANYTLASLATGTGTITAKALTLNAVTDSRAYDGTTASTGQVIAQGLIAGDGILATQGFDGKDAGSHLLQVANYTVLDGNGGGNYVVTLGDKVAGTITKKVLNATATVNNKTYDGTTGATGSVVGLSGVVGQENVTVDGSGLFAFVDRNAGNGKAVTVTGLTLSGSDAGNYQLSDVANGTANIAKAILTLTASTDSKIYDGTTASNGLVGISGLVTGDTATATQAFNSKNAGDRKLGADSWTIEDGNSGGNYTVVRVAADGSIAQKQLSGALTGTVSKVYDGTAAATLLGTNLDGVIAGDAVIVSAADAFYADKNAGTGKLVTVSGMSLSGNDAANYVLTHNSASANVGEIKARTITIDVDGRGAKTYDGTTALSAEQLGTLHLVAAKGDSATQLLMASDGVWFNIGSVTGELADRNAGTGKSVIFTGYTLTGNDLGNYVLASNTALGVADIARARLTLTASGDGKVYDGTTTSNGAVTISGLVGSDTASAIQAFDSKNAGDHLVKVGSNYLINDGNEGGNYLVTLVDAQGAISKRLVSTTLTVQDKTYDGTTKAVGNFTPLSNVIGGDAVGISADLNFDDRNAGTNKLVTISNSILTGADAANYELDPLAPAGTATIHQANLVLNAVTDVRQYDGTTASTGQVQAVGLVAGDTLNATQSFDGKNAGAHILAVNGGWTLDDGNGGNNYVVTVGNTASGAITQRVLTATATVNDKTYDGTTAATGSIGGLSNVIGNENVQIVGGTLAFADRNANTGKAVNVTGATLTGADAANYILSAIAGGTATIHQASLVLNAVDDTKVYDGTTASSGKVTANGLIAGDSFGATQSFASKNAGAQVLSVDGGYAVFDGNGGNNYIVTIGNTGSGKITPKEIQVSSSVNSKTYDGTTAATGAITGLTGVIAGDKVGLNGTAQFAFADRNASNGKVVNVSGVTLTGLDAGNYTVGTVANGTANIAKAVLTLTASGENKVYDGTTASNGAVTIGGLFGTDTATATQAFTSKNAGSATLSANGWTIDDGNAGGNYTVVKVDAAGNIARKQLTGAVTGTVTKTYDGTTAATLLPVNIDGVIAGDALTLKVASANYADKNVGNGKLVTVSGMVLDGADAGNYELLTDSVSAEIGTITARTVTIGSSGIGSKTYDGTTLLSNSQLGTLEFMAAYGDAVTQALLAGDGILLDTSGVTGLLIDRNAGTGKSVDLTGFALTNNDLGNYVLIGGPIRSAANIAKAVLTLTASTDSKLYDGTTASAAQVQIAGLAAGDIASATQAFDGWNAGSRNLAVNGYTLDDGNGGGNYTVSMVSVGGDIAQRVLDIAIGDASKTVGGVDPSFGYTLVGGDGLIQGDGLSGQLVRDAGEAVGSYAIGQGSLTAGGNYKLTVTPGRFTIVAGAGGDGGGTTPNPGDGGGTTPNPGDGGGTTPNPGDGGGTTPNPGDGGGTTPNPGDGGGTTPNPGDGGGTTPNPGDGGGTTPNPGDGGGTTPNPGDGGGTTPNPGDGGGTTPNPGDGGGTTPNPGNGGTTPNATVVRNALKAADQAVRALTDTFSSNTTLQAGVGGPFDAGAVFGSRGTSRLPGSVANSVQNQVEVGLEEVETGPAGADRACTSGGQNDDSCGAVEGSGLPYATNRIVSSVLRFLGR